MKAFCIAALLLGSAASAGAAAPAQPAAPAPMMTAPARPEGDLRVFSATRTGAAWGGERQLVILSDLCVASTTGRFRLSVVSKAAGQAGPVYTIRFRDGAGIEQSARLSGSAIASFLGSSPGRDDCREGANASLEFDAPDTELLRQAAGAYTDQFTLSVEPL